MTRNRAVGVAAVLAALSLIAGIGLAMPRTTDGPRDIAAASASFTSASRRPSAISPSAVGPSATASIAPPATSSTSPAPSAVEASSAPPPSPTVAPAAGLRPGSVNRSSLAVRATYRATVRVGWTTRSFRVWTTIAVTNTSSAAIDRLELNTIAARLGGMRIVAATVDGRTVTPSVSDQTIRLPLGGILDPGASTTVHVAYRSTLRSTLAGSAWLFTRANGILAAHRWIPWISRATAFDRPNSGDPFVTPVSPQVRVVIVADRPIRWATTGEQTSVSGVTTMFEATNVRDFVITGAPDYRTAAATVGGVVVRVWYRPGFPVSTVLAAAKTALGREARLLGPYPYRTYDVAQTAGGSGMEAPGLTWVPTHAGSLPYLLAHETAHQWFYGIVGNDQARNPYADEAAADMVARYVTGLRRAPRCSAGRLDLTIYAYSGSCYYERIYIEGGNFLDDLRRSMGTTAYWNAIRDYLTANRFKLSTTKRLLDAIDSHTPLDLRGRYRLRFPSLY